jgi:DNA/RNA-binding domain of Phe-tRNA-synthetase-like protein
MTLFQVTKKVREKYPQLNFYGVKVEELKVTKKLLYKDSQKTMVTEATKNVYILTVQYFPILEEDAKTALEAAVDLVTTSSQGSAEAIRKSSIE